MYKWIISFFILAITFKAQSEDKRIFNIDGHITNYKYRTALLAEFYGDNKNIIDTALVDSNGSFNFILNERNQAGLYRVVFRGGKFIDVVFNNENISFKTDYNSAFQSLEINKSIETQAYYEYLNRRNHFEYKLDLLKPLISNFPKDDSFYRDVMDKFLGIENEQRAYTDSIIDAMNGTYVSRLIKTDRLPVFRPEWTDAERTAYLTEHFFDAVDFNDVSLLNSNAIPQKLIAFLTLHTSKKLKKDEQQEAFLPAVDTILKKSSVNSEMYAFVLDYIVKGFETFNYQKVLTHIALNYAIDDQCENNERKSKLQHILDGQRFLQIGSKAPDISIKDFDGEEVSLHSIKAKYTVLVFWAAWCPHCRELMPTLNKLYESKLGEKIEVMAISLDKDKELWAKVINKWEFTWVDCCDFKEWDSPAAVDYYIYSTPTIFLLDKDKNIIMKPVSVPEIKNKIIELENL